MRLSGVVREPNVSIVVLQSLMNVPEILPALSVGLTVVVPGLVRIAGALYSFVPSVVLRTFMSTADKIVTDLDVPITISQSLFYVFQVSLTSLICGMFGLMRRRCRLSHNVESIESQLRERREERKKERKREDRMQEWRKDMATFRRAGRQ